MTQSQDRCECGDRLASECPGAWEQGCDLGANEAHVRVAPESAEFALKLALSQPTSAQPVAEPAAWRKAAEAWAKSLGTHLSPSDDPTEAIRAIIERDRALRPSAQHAAQPVAQEPFLHAVVSKRAPIIDKAIRRLDVAQEYADKCSETYPGVEIIPLYAAPVAQPVPQAEPVRQPLTYDQIVDALVDGAGLNLAYRSYEDDMKFARAIERAHGINNGTEGTQ